MPYYALFYDVVEDFIARRATYREEHLRLAREAQARGELVLAGALADPADGALIVFQAESPATAEAFARHDPYVKNGLVANWKVRAWTVVVGNELRAPYIEKRAGRSLPDMIARFWSAHTTPTLADAYLHHFEQVVQPPLQRLDGFLGATVCTRPVPGAVEIVVTTYWKSFAAIDAFAGADRDAALVTAEAAALLTDFDKRVRHYEVALADFPQITAG